MFKRAMSNCANCCNQKVVNHSLTMRFLGAYKDIGRKRMADDTEEIKGQEWYKRADNRDFTISSGLFLGSILIGGAVGLKKYYDEVTENNTYRDESLQMQTLAITGASAGIGFLLAVIYPFPSIISFIGGGILFHKASPTIIRTIKYGYNSKK